ncbi:TPA: CDP-glycerol--glycerophosphate glycerophosphotransferase, partial [Escherichia coli]|nr:CDP-glycerol--glycerophosphate glycerophosphotransferase [Escherichia coli]
NYIKDFSCNLLHNTDVPVIVWDRSKMAELDGLFDIIICQTIFFRMETFVKTKIVMIQYGYAKEPHNYGAWRSLGDLCLTYGDYARKKISHFCPSVSIGNPRYDKWHKVINNKDVQVPENNNVTLKKILYVPTWGDLSSIDYYLDE